MCPKKVRHSKFHIPFWIFLLDCLPVFEPNCIFHYPNLPYSPYQQHPTPTIPSLPYALTVLFQKLTLVWIFLYGQSNCLSVKTRKNLCSALILCHFDYSCSFSYAGLNKGLKRKLQIAQNKVIRFINQLGPRTRITSDILMNLNLLNVETRVKQLRLNRVHKIFYNLCPSYLQESFVPLRDVHHHNILCLVFTTA